MQLVETEPDPTAAAIRDFLWNNDEMLKGNPETYVDHPLGGACYTASEAYYHLLEDKSAWTPECLAVEWTEYDSLHGSMTHWYLRHESGKIVDLTAEQFDPLPVEPRYEGGIGRGFVPPSPSERSQRVIEAIEEEAVLVA